MTEAVPYKFPKDRAEDARIEHQRQMDREYDEKFSENQDNEKLEVNFIENSSYCKKVVIPTDEEIVMHKNYLKTTLKKNYF